MLGFKPPTHPFKVHHSRPITNRHDGKTFIIGGTSPWREDSDFIVQKMHDSILIGVNRYVEHFVCHYWLTCDTHRIQERMPRVLYCMPDITQTFVNADFPLPKGLVGAWTPDYRFSRPNGKLNDRLQPDGHYRIPRIWEAQDSQYSLGLLQHVHTSATAAVNLAMIMGAERIILHGVDLMGETLTAANGMAVKRPWAEFADDVSEFLNKVAQYVPVYKTNVHSPLDIPVLI